MSYSWPSVFYIHAGDGSTTGYYAVTKRPQNSAVTAGSLVRQFTAPSFQSERVFACVVAGTTANTTDASWSTSKGTKTTDGTATWIEVTGQPGVNGDFGSNCPVWVASATPPLGLVIYHSGASSLQVCTTSGAGGGSTPSFSATAGVTASDGSAVWTSLGPTSGFGTWGAPHATLEAAVSYGVAGNDFYIADNSTYVPSSSRTINAPSAPYNGSVSRVLSIDHTKSLPPSSGSLKAGAAIGTSSGSIPSMNLINSVQNSYWYGITISITNWGGLTIGGSGSGTPIAVFDGCQFNLANSHVSANFNGPGFFTLNNCTFNLVSSGQVLNLGSSRVIWKNTSSPFPGAAPGNFIFANGNGAYWGTCMVENVDLSACTGAVIAGQPNYPGGMFTLKDCKLPSSGPITSGMYPGVIADVIRCDSGGTNYRNERHDEWGDLWTATNAHRSGGASDGTTPVSWKMYGRNSVWVLPFEGWRMAQWNSITGTNRVVTVYGCVFAGSLPNNDDIWIEAEYQGSASSPVGSVANSTKADPFTSNAALSSDTSTWVGTARQNNHSYSVGDIMQPTGDPNRVYYCTVAGTSLSSEPAAYASATDGQTIQDGTGAGAAYFIACTRFKLTVTLNSPQPAQAGYLYVTPKLAKQSTYFLIDPLINLT